MPNHNTLQNLIGIPFAANLTIHPGHWLKITRPDGSVVRVRIVDPNHDPLGDSSNIGTANNANSTLTPGHSDTFTIGLVDAHGLTKQVLNWHNCYSFGNGVESNRITDNFNTQRLTPGVKVSTMFEDYKEEHRKYGLIYSGLYNDISGMNNLNQFIQAEKITKDINPIYGSIQKLHARDTDLVTLCEDKVLRILASKDAVYNADGNPQLTATNRVLGQTVPFVGEFGISRNPESFVSEAYRSYFTDKQRGAVMRLSKDGLTPISAHGMKDWFRDNLKLSNKLVGSYDDRNDEYNVTLDATADGPTTVSFREDVKGWVSFKSFIPESAISCANDYFTIKQGKLYKHYDEEENRNTFYDTYADSSINVILNEQPGSVKSFNTLDYEGSESRVEGIRTVEITGIEYAGGAHDGQYFFFEESNMNSLLNRSDWSAIGTGISPGNPEKAIEMKQYRNNILIHSGLIMLWDSSGYAAINSPSGGPTKGSGRRTMPDGSWGTASNLGDFEVGDVITTEQQEKSVNVFNSMPKDGWYVSNIETDKQKGNLPEFIEKEGKWFNYIKGLDFDINATTNFGAFDIQGIGLIDVVDLGGSGTTPEITFANNINSSLQVGDTLYFERPSETLGENLIIDGGFDSLAVDSSWSVDPELAWTISGGIATGGIEPGSLRQFLGGDKSLVEGETYEITYDITSGSTASGELVLFNHGLDNANIDLLESNTVATHTIRWVQGPNNINRIKLYSNDIFDGSIDNISVRKVSIGGVFGFTRLESDNIQKCGVVTNITNNTVTVDDSGTPPSEKDYIMFAKNHAINTSSLLGYYADVKFKNDSIKEAELFAVSSEITESSK